MKAPRFGLATLMLLVLSIGLAMALAALVRRENRLLQQLAAVQAENAAVKKERDLFARESANLMVLVRQQQMRKAIEVKAARPD